MLSCSYFIQNTKLEIIDLVLIPCHESAEEVLKKGLAMEILLQNKSSDLRNLLFQDANLCGLDFSGRDFSGSDFGGSIFRGSRFEACKLENSNFQKTDLRDVQVIDSDLSQACFQGALIRCEELGSLLQGGCKNVSNNLMESILKKERYVT